MKIDLSQRRALVCGASQGIGFATAKVLAECGCKIVALSRSEEKLAKLISELPGSGHMMVPHDLNDLEGLKVRLDIALQEKGGIDIIVLNSGGPPAGPLAEATIESLLNPFREHIAANQTILQKLLPHMRAQKFGRIINIISTSVKAPIPQLGVSNTIRAAVASWAKTLAGELGSDGITVNNILPGYTETPRLAALLQNFAQKNHITFEQAQEQWKLRVPARRFADPRETAYAVAFLSSDLAGYINGINMPVDGGRLDSL